MRVRANSLVYLLFFFNSINVLIKYIFGSFINKYWEIIQGFRICSGFTRSAKIILNRPSAKCLTTLVKPPTLTNLEESILIICKYLTREEFSWQSFCSGINLNRVLALHIRKLLGVLLMMMWIF